MIDRTLKILEQEMQEEDRRFFETETARIVENADMKCMYKHHAKHRGDFRKELRQGNPDCLCLECDGYNDECSSYTKRQ